MLHRSHVATTSGVTANDDYLLYDEAIDQAGHPVSGPQHGAMAVVGEKASRNALVAFSITNSVAISPPDYPGEFNPFADDGGKRAAGKRLERRLEKLLAAGSVIEVTPGK